MAVDIPPDFVRALAYCLAYDHWKKPAVQKRFAQAPRPYIFHISMEYTGSPNLKVGLVLMRRALDYLSYFLHVLQETGRQGMGRARVPYRLRSVHDGAYPEGLELWRSDVGAALTLFLCGATWTLQDAWRDAARHIDVVEHTLTLQHLECYSNRHQHTLPRHDLVGSLRLAGALAPFLPLLRLGEYTYSGAGTAFGLGQYRLVRGAMSGM